MLKVEILTLRQFIGKLLNVRRNSDGAVVKSGIIRDATTSGCGGYGTIFLEGHQPYPITQGVANEHTFEILNPDGSKMSEEKAEVKA